MSQTSWDPLVATLALVALVASFGWSGYSPFPEKTEYEKNATGYILPASNPESSQTA